MRTLRTLADVVDWGLCVGCGACVTACDKGGVSMTHVEAEGFRPVFHTTECAQCSSCLDVCPGAGVTVPARGQGPDADSGAEDIGPCVQVLEGYATDPAVRFSGSSGGVLSALSLFCLERGGYEGIIHAGMDPASPWTNKNFVSRTRDDVLQRTGSRYAPSMPCAAPAELDLGSGPHVFIGKPCDTAAMARLQARGTPACTTIGLVLTFFCAGTPSARGTLDLVERLGGTASEISSIRYRGHGWPGMFTATRLSGDVLPQVPYIDAWRSLTGYRPLRCNLCPDGLGRVADVSCGDAWHLAGDDGNPGCSLILVRTEAGRKLIADAVAAGYLTISPAGADHVRRAQNSLLERRRLLFGRLLALRLLLVPTPTFRGFSLLRSWVRGGPRAQASSVAGTIKRVLGRRWYRRRPLGTTSAAGDGRTQPPTSA